MIIDEIFDRVGYEKVTLWLNAATRGIDHIERDIKLHELLESCQDVKDTTSIKDLERIIFALIQELFTIKK